MSHANITPEEWDEFLFDVPCKYSKEPGSVSIPSVMEPWRWVTDDDGIWWMSVHLPYLECNLALKASKPYPDNTVEVSLVAYNCFDGPVCLWTATAMDVDLSDRVNIPVWASGELHKRIPNIHKEWHYALDCRRSAYLWDRYNKMTGKGVQEFGGRT
jgi:hypothetical protein